MRKIINALISFYEYFYYLTERCYTALEYDQFDTEWMDAKKFNETAA